MLLSFSAYSTLKVKEIYSSETSLIFIGLHGVISQKIALFISTALRTSNPTLKSQFLQADWSHFMCNIRTSTSLIKSGCTAERLLLFKLEKLFTSLGVNME
jgi:hypothetical protein